MTSKQISKLTNELRKYGKVRQFNPDKLLSIFEQISQDYLRYEELCGSNETELVK